MVGISISLIDYWYYQYLIVYMLSRHVHFQKNLIILSYFVDPRYRYLPVLVGISQRYWYLQYLFLAIRPTSNLKTQATTEYQQYFMCWRGTCQQPRNYLAFLLSAFVIDIIFQIGRGFQKHSIVQTPAVPLHHPHLCVAYGTLLVAQYCSNGISPSLVKTYQLTYQYYTLPDFNVYYYIYSACHHLILF